MFERRRALLDRLLVLRQEAARLAAEQLQGLGEFAVLDRDAGDPLGECTQREVAAVTKVSDRYAASWLALAETVTTRLPATLKALHDGLIDEYKVRRMADATDVLSDELAGQVEDELLPQAEQ
jgi:hypothetical protein